MTSVRYFLVRPTKQRYRLPYYWQVICTRQLCSQLPTILITELIIYIYIWYTILYEALFINEMGQLKPEFYWTHSKAINGSYSSAMQHYRMFAYRNSLSLSLCIHLYCITINGPSISTRCTVDVPVFIKSFQFYSMLSFQIYSM